MVARLLSERIEQGFQTQHRQRERTPGNGEQVSDPLQRSRLFPEEIIEMIAVGEESNQLEKVLIHTADTVERRTNRQVDAAVRLVEPLLLMFMAGAIGFIALGLLYPIFTMARSMR